MWDIFYEEAGWFVVLPFHFSLACPLKPNYINTYACYPWTTRQDIQARDG